MKADKEREVYRCGWCGTPTDIKGEPIKFESDEWFRVIKIIDEIVSILNFLILMFYFLFILNIILYQLFLTFYLFGYKSSVVFCKISLLSYIESTYLTGSLPRAYPCFSVL